MEKGAHWKRKVQIFKLKNSKIAVKSILNTKSLKKTKIRNPKLKIKHKIFKLGITKCNSKMPSSKKAKLKSLF